MLHLPMFSRSPLQKRAMDWLDRHRPADADALHAFVLEYLKLNVPRKAMIAGNDAPFDYLVESFLGHDGSAKPQASGEGGEHVGGVMGKDLIVWANRGGGKTMLGAVATLLDMLFKPGIRICILGGSLEQSSRMFGHLRRLADTELVRPMLLSVPTQRRLVLINRSRTTILCQSQRSVRGIRVQKLRCDEVDEFEQDVWEAAQYVTRSEQCGPVAVRGGIEAISTMHRPFGLMSKVVENAATSPNMRVLRWSALDVAARCEPTRECTGCKIWDDCKGIAKHASGFVSIDDLLQQRHRNGVDRWASEMMCQRPSQRDQVYGEFDPKPGGKHVLADAATPTTLAIPASATLIAGMDFGMRNPLAMVWALVHRQGHDPLQWTVEILDEYSQKDTILDQHLTHIQRRGWPMPAWIGVDPAGNARSLQTGESDVQHLRRAGYRVHSLHCGLEDGLGLIRRRLDHGTLHIHRNCTQLIHDLAMYHYDPNRVTSEQPVKDGPDHLCDALRYMLTCLEQISGEVRTRGY